MKHISYNVLMYIYEYETWKSFLFHSHYQQRYSLRQKLHENHTRYKREVFFLVRNILLEIISCLRYPLITSLLLFFSSEIPVIMYTYSILTNINKIAVTLAIVLADLKQI